MYKRKTQATFLDTQNNDTQDSIASEAYWGKKIKMSGNS